MVKTIKRFLDSLGHYPDDRFPSYTNSPTVSRAYSFASYGFFNSTLAHVLFLAIFTFLSVKILALFNIFSVIVWVIAFTLIRKGYFWQGYALGAIELIIHAALCVIVVGWDTGFQYYIFIHPILVFLSHWKLSTKIIISFIFGVSYIAMAHYAAMAEPIVVLDSMYIAALNYMNITSAIIQPVIATYVYYNATIRAEEKLKKEHEKTSQALLERNQALTQLNSELSEAAEYVKKLLPKPVRDGSVLTDWRFVPSTSLGGDAFGYHHVDKNHFAFYLIDVSGHGVGAALLSVSVINMLRSQSLPDTDFKDPERVLKSLNKAFPSGANKDMFFTIWYGVYNICNRELIYASAGHPPAILCDNNSSCNCKIDLLKTPNFVVGAFDDPIYAKSKCNIDKGNTLYIFSDGVYEVEKSDGTMWSFKDFVEYLKKNESEKQPVIDSLYEYVKTIGKSNRFDDDFTILKVAFS